MKHYIVIVISEDETFFLSNAAGDPSTTATFLDFRESHAVLFDFKRATYLSTEMVKLRMVDSSYIKNVIDGLGTDIQRAKAL